MKRFIDESKGRGKKIKTHQALIIFLKFMSSVMPTIRYDQALDIEIWLFMLEIIAFLFYNINFNMAAVLDASTIVLLNIYLIMALQLGFNWNNTACNTDSNLFQLGFIVLMSIRLFFHELYNNRKFGKGVSAFFNFLLSGLLLALGIYQAITVFKNPSDFYYDPTTKSGNEICFQNRIVFVGEIIIIGFTVVKDVYFVCCQTDNEDSVVKPAWLKNLYFKNVR